MGFGYFAIHNQHMMIKQENSVTMDEARQIADVTRFEIMYSLDFTNNGEKESFPRSYAFCIYTNRNKLLCISSKDLIIIGVAIALFLAQAVCIFLSAARLLRVWVWKNLGEFYKRALDFYVYWFTVRPCSIVINLQKYICQSLITTFHLPEINLNHTRPDLSA